MSGFLSTASPSSSSSTSVAKCNSCKAIFTSLEVVKEHYKSDWHVFNSKRRANNLAPLSLADFRKICPQLKKSRRALSSSATSSSAVSSSSPPLGSISSSPKQLSSSSESVLAPSSSSTSEEYKKLALKLGVKEDRVETVLRLALEENEASGESDLYDNLNSEDGISEEIADNEEENDTEIEMPSIAPNISIFDNKVLESTDECIIYMEKTFGFFIPDREYITDLDGFLTYLGEKVKLGGYCLYCQKTFQPGRPCQNHMISKSHCKIAYEEDIDLDEYEDFYDFTSTYDGVEGVEEDEDGNVVTRTLEVSHLGELILLDGRTVGHRDLNTYYKQHYKPPDNRPSILAQKREELLRLETMFGALKMDPGSIERLSDAQVVSLIRQERKTEKKALMLAQRAEKKRSNHWSNQRREYQSNVDAKRSSQNMANQQIRDYHSRLV